MISQDGAVTHNGNTKIFGFSVVVDTGCKESVITSAIVEERALTRSGWHEQYIIAKVELEKPPSSSDGGHYEAEEIVRFRIVESTEREMALAYREYIAVSYTHLTLPTICSV